MKNKSRLKIKLTWGTSSSSISRTKISRRSKISGISFTTKSNARSKCVKMHFRSRDLFSALKNINKSLIHFK